MDVKSKRLFLCYTLSIIVLVPPAKPETNIIDRYASKTRYRANTGNWRRPENCKPKYIDMLVRHGTRHPSKKDVKKIDAMLSVVNAFFYERQFLYRDLKLPWRNEFFVENDKILTKIGKEEMKNLSARMKNRLPELFINSPELYSFYSTDTTRTIESASAFVSGLYGDHSNISIVSVKKDKDHLLRFFDQCPLYKTKVSDNKTALYHTKRFREGTEMNDVLKKVVLKLGLTAEQQRHLKPKHLTAMYIACSFEVAVFDRHNTWCELFDSDDFEVLEYLYDLKHYWKRAYGYTINYRMSCTLFADIVKNILNAVNLESRTEPIAGEKNHTKKLGVFRFAHAETLQPLYALLGLFKDKEELRADNFAKHNSRKYRTSFVVPFGANIAFVIYSCDSSQHKNTLDNFQLQVYVGEKLIQLPCGDEISCPLVDFLNIYSKHIDRCVLSEICKAEERTEEHEEL